MKNYYKILNVSENATSEEIKSKFKKKARKYHPDKNKDLHARKKFELINEAYNTLIDPYERGKYDAKLEMNLSNIDSRFNDTMSLFSNIDNSSLFDINNSSISKNVKSYSFVSSSSTKNGKIITKKKYKTNINGKEKKYYQEYETDKDGNLKIIKEKGDKCLFKTNNLRLKDNED